MSKKRIKPNYHRRVLRIPDLDHCKLAVLNSLGSPASRRVYEYAIDQFTAWYCSEPRLAFNRIVVVRYRCTPRLSTNPREYSLPLRFLTSLDRSHVPKSPDLGDPASPVSQIQETQRQKPGPFDPGFSSSVAKQYTSYGMVSETVVVCCTPPPDPFTVMM